MSNFPSNTKKEEEHPCSPSPSHFASPSPFASPSRFARTLKAWPIITLLTISLCLLTQEGAKLFGIELPEQQNVEVVKRCLTQAFASWKAFGFAALLVAQVLLIMPAIEELIFRWGLFKLPTKLAGRFSRGRISVKCAEEETLSSSHMAHFAEMRPQCSRPVLIFFAALSSALFSAAHYIAQPWPDNAFLALFFFGLAQCWLYRKTRRLWCAILNHALFNLTNLTLLFILPTP